MKDTIAGMFKRRAKLSGAYDRVYDTPEGRIVIEDLLRKSGLLEAAHVPGDTAGTAFRDGRRSMGLEILEVLRWNEAELVRLAREQTSQRVAESEYAETT